MTIQEFIETVQFKFGKDLSVYSATFLRKTLTQRLKDTGSGTTECYLDFLSTDKAELQKLIDSFHVSYSIFFRNDIDVALLEGYILPEMIQAKEKNNSHSLRMWSAGCADGTESFSLAMLADKAISNRNVNLDLMVFGTDISSAVVKKAQAATFNADAVQNVKLAYLNRYFTIQNSQYSVIEDIKRKVYFSPGDIIDIQYTSPPAGIFADFDIVSCCNLLIYYNQETQQLILEKLYRSLGRKGYLVVGESEQLIVEKSKTFRLFSPIGNIFVKE